MRTDRVPVSISIIFVRICGYVVLVLYIYIYIVCVQLLGRSGGLRCVILVLRECIWNTPEVSLVLPAFDVTGSLGSPSRQVVHPPG